MTTATGKPPIETFFDRNMAEHYDARNANLAIMMQSLHFQVNLILEDLPRNARILCIGAGTGAEILTLAGLHPEWHFTAADPSSPMLDKCRKRIAEAGLSDRCDLVDGYVQDVAAAPEFDAILSLMVAHFIPREDRAPYYSNIIERLKPGGMLVSSEISFDPDAPDFPLLLKNWTQIQKLMGGSPESLEKLPYMLRNVLSIETPEVTEGFMRSAGFDLPIRFFQNFFIRAWYAAK